MKPADIVGSVFNRWKVLEAAGTDKNRNKLFKCKCSCGNIKTVLGFQLKSGKSKSCGCLQVESTARNITHGMSKSREYKIWTAMWQRCTNPNANQHGEYKGRLPDERWKSFENFYADMGPRPSRLYTLERINNDLGYGPDNCKWATREEQNNNTSRNTKYLVAGKLMTAKEFAKYLGISYEVLRYRLLVQKFEVDQIIDMEGK